MKTARRRLDTGAIILSAAVHAAVLAVVALQAPKLRIYDDTAGPPLPVIPIIIEPRVPPAASGEPSAPAPIRLHRRPPRGGPVTAPPEPLPAPAAPAAEEPPARPRAEFHPAPLPSGPKSDLRATLRNSPVGCGNPDAVGLNRAEREGCNESLGARVRITPFQGLALDPDKQSDFDRAAARKEANRRYKSSPIQPGPGQSANPGQSATDLQQSLGGR